MDGEISWVLKNVKFGTKVVSSMGMMCTLTFLEKIFNCGEICSKHLKWRKMQKNGNFFSTQYLKTKHSRNVEIGTSAAHV